MKKGEDELFLLLGNYSSISYFLENVSRKYRRRRGPIAFN